MPTKLHAGYRLAIVNPLTLVGSEVKTLLHDRGIPYQKITLLSSLDDEKGALTEVGDEPAVVQAISDIELEGLDLVFFCGSGEVNLPWLEKRDEHGYIAVDLSQPPSGIDGTPVVAGINDDAVDGSELIISPHPAATPLILLLGQLRKSIGIELCTATVIQPASEWGQAGIDELMQQTISMFNMGAVPKEIFDRQLAFNLYPAPPSRNDERQAAGQVRSVLGGIPLALSVVQGTVFHGHSFSLFLKTSGASRDEVIAALGGHPAIQLGDSDEPFSTLDAAGRDQILVSAVREDEFRSGSFWIWMVSDNLRRGSALNAVLVAESVLARVKPILQ